MEQVTDAATQTRLIARYPQLFYRLSTPTPMVEWLVAALSPELFAERKPQALSIRYAAREMKELRGTLPAQGAGLKPLVVENIPWPEMPLTAAKHILPARPKTGWFS